MSLQIGDKLQGRFEITRALSSGGMGSVYEARDRAQEGRRCAVKMMLSHLLDGQNAEIFRHRFRTEIELLEKLAHPGIPRYIASFENELGFFLVMEFVQGRNLEQELEERLRLTNTPFPMDQCLRDARQILDILAHLHGQSPALVHRDVKPANLIREHPSGRVKLVDFGLARALDSSSVHQTQIGTLGYAPLEQLQGRAEPRSDLYALGASLHHLLSGQPPKPLDIAPLHILRPDLSTDMVAWINCAIASEPTQRFRSAQTMLKALNEIRPALPLKPSEAEAPAPKPGVRKPTPAAPPTRLFTSAPDTNMMEIEGEAVAMGTITTVTPREPRAFKALPGPNEDPGEASGETAASLPPPIPPAPVPPQPPVVAAASANAPASKNGLWAALLLLGVGAAFMAGRLSTPQPVAAGSPLATPTVQLSSSGAASPTSAPRLDPLPTQPTPLAVQPVATATPPSSLRTGWDPSSELPRANPPKRKGPSRISESDEPNQSHSLSGPHYPTRNGPVAVRSAPKRQPARPKTVQITASDAFDPIINLPEGWSQVARSRSGDERRLSFQKDGPTANSPLRLTVRTYITQQPKRSIEQAFHSRRSDWNRRLDLPGVDEALERNKHGTQELEALVTRSGRYYVLRLECGGGILQPEQFQKEIQEALASVDFP